MVSQICGNYSKTKSEIIKQHQKDHILLYFYTSVDSSSDKPKALLRNVGSQPLYCQNSTHYVFTNSALRAELV